MVNDRFFTDEEIEEWVKLFDSSNNSFNFYDPPDEQENKYDPNIPTLKIELDKSDSEERTDNIGLR